MGIDTETREYVDECQQKLPSSMEEYRVVFGFDGVVDRVRTAVATRYGPDEYERMETLEEFGNRIVDAASIDTSCSIEWFSERKRAGGHTAHLGRAMERLGHRPTIVGTYGTPPRETFTREYNRTRLVSLGSAPITDAVEFTDGKVLLSDTRKLANLDWERICSTIELNSLAATIDRTNILGLGYWATIPAMPSIWEGLRRDLWPRLRDPPDRILVDPADVRRLPPETLLQGIEPLSKLDDTVPITMSMNRAEAIRFANELGVDEEGLAEFTPSLRERLGVSELVIHAVTESTLATSTHDYRTKIPRTVDPEITTSAGDHFNAGLVIAELAGISGGARLIVGSAVAGWFVRNGSSPTYAELLEFIDQYETYF